MRPPEEAEIRAPEFPPKLTWLNVAFLRMDRLLGSHAVLVEFFDSARINSRRTLPYVAAWHERYAAHGLRVIGVHSPGYSFGRDPAVAERLASELAIEHAVVLDPDLLIWHEYGNRGWPARYLFDRAGILRYVHYGEGQYPETERAITGVLREIDPDADLPEPLDPLRPEDAEGALLEPQTADIALPADRDRVELVRDWDDGEDFVEAQDAGGAATVQWSGGSAWAVLSGSVESGLYETDGEIVAADPGLRLHGFQFTPRPPS